MSPAQDLVVWCVAAVATLGVLLRPWRTPEALWPALGSLVLVASGILSLSDAWVGVAAGADVYLFLLGMMLLAEIAREEGLFDWLATVAARHAGGSATRLFALVYLVGALVTIFLSNDATAVVLTPAVAAVVKAMRIQRPLPYIFICAFVANAASFVLPISNPANLVIYGAYLPPLLEWLPRFGLASAVSIGVTYAVLFLTQRSSLEPAVATEVPGAPLSRGGRAAALGIILAALGLMAASAAGVSLGFSTIVAGLATASLVWIRTGRVRWEWARRISWDVIAMVAGLFVLVEALKITGLVQTLSGLLAAGVAQSPDLTSVLAAGAVAIGSNVANNLPVGLLAGQALQALPGLHAAPAMSDVPAAVLIGIDLGPNLCVTGSLATLLWLSALRREGLHVRALDFLRLGVLVMPPALILGVAALLLR